MQRNNSAGTRTPVVSRNTFSALPGGPLRHRLHEMPWHLQRLNIGYGQATDAQHGCFRRLELHLPGSLLVRFDPA
jgi:hypothetical protein